VTVEHRVVVSTEDEVTVLETRAVITDTPVKCIILFGVAMLVHETWKQHITVLPRKLARIIRLLNCTREFFGSYIVRDTCYPDVGSVTFLSLSSEQIHRSLNIFPFDIVFRDTESVATGNLTKYK
jgi:hypothetical protein